MGERAASQLSPNTIRLARSLLRKAFAYGLAVDAVVSNPVEQVKPPKTRKTVPAHWSPEEARQFLGSARRRSPLSAVGVHAQLWGSGQRAGVAAVVKRQPLRRYARLNEFPTTIGYRLTASQGKNQTAVRTIDLDDHLVNVLEMQATSSARSRTSPATRKPTTCSPNHLAVTTTPRRSQNDSAESPSSSDCPGSPLTGSATPAPR